MAHSTFKVAVKRDFTRAELQQRVGDRVAAEEAGMTMEEWEIYGTIRVSVIQEIYIYVQIGTVTTKIKRQMATLFLLEIRGHVSYEQIKTTRKWVIAKRMFMIPDVKNSATV
ncbi:Hypothetical predicted protein [Octopus vulgaris]|uniref:Uncharacterized protein n=1 Tax=Octopus vulgaris TaxID=6645 RepID=A0AA36EY66_OCTVU|nr:Hypothetical predicted protein [Octopus vulgaris]